MVKGSLSVVVPALNEEKNLRQAVREIGVAFGRLIDGWEIVVVDDGSTDATGKIAEELSREDPHVRAVHHDRPRGLGASFRHGVEVASKEYCLLVPGDNENPADSLVGLLARMGEADIVVTRVENTEERGLFRRALSRTYTAVLNGLFGLRLPYYNGPTLYRRTFLLSLPPWSSGFAYQAQILIPLLRGGATYAVASIRIRRVEGSSTKAFKPKNVATVFWTILRLFWDLRIAPLWRLARDPGRPPAPLPGGP